MQQNPIVFDAAKNEGLVNFTTNGSPTPAVVNTLAVTNRATLNSFGSPIVDWLPVSGAKEYNVYRATSLAGGAYGAFERIATVTNSDFTDTVNFVDLDLKVSYKYMVRPVSRDNRKWEQKTFSKGLDLLHNTCYVYNSSLAQLKTHSLLYLYTLLLPNEGSFVPKKDVVLFQMQIDR